ncbi:CDP-diacylglycerol--glycerol-3-phosphate 3-phosphatidyltransferase [Sulfurihydrogenibium azorense]|uniref:CDP-diacylglycerol--glycerol-3-phosphate 3-phosphatidyltransferase n=1 Tax=Sulfurihydrogenibium azorense TaxID=309806 RepID=UPI00240A6705|nr:CDP-diacylglycerol--glycerol-3-phosphate 3-phosphatidyltransferase [Sulfurihydrogenibium azorense]MDM7274347.1 CDP-diacylglycerol--glycerol-3-phosphate 3-phosphatidyltransferase [Sulfurihydrogenibium azorense]
MSIGLANLITLSRLALIPFIMYFILNDKYLISGVLVLLAIISDYLDGIVARLSNDVTKHGELLDPAVDKIFTVSVLTAFVSKHYISPFEVFLIVSREMLVTWVRSVMVNKGIVIPAFFLGKVKTTLQLVAILLLAVNFIDYGKILLWFSIFVAYISGFEYFLVFYREKAWK